MIGSEMQKLFQNHWKLHTKLLNWSFSLLNVIHIFEESTKQSKAIAKHTDNTFKKMKTDENRHLFWEDVKQKEQIQMSMHCNCLGKEEHLNMRMMIFPTIAEYILNT